jgi:hypothetical protein
MAKRTPIKMALIHLTTLELATQRQEAVIASE